MVGGDGQVVAQVEAVGGGSGGSDAGVQMDRRAVQAPGLGGEPVEQAVGKASTAHRGEGGDVVDEEVVAPGGGVGFAESRHR